MSTKITYYTNGEINALNKFLWEIEYIYIVSFRGEHTLVELFYISVTFHMALHLNAFIELTHITVCHK